MQFSLLLAPLLWKGTVHFHHHSDQYNSLVLYVYIVPWGGLKELMTYVLIRPPVVNENRFAQYASIKLKLDVV